MYRPDRKNDILWFKNLRDILSFLYIMEGDYNSLRELKIWKKRESNNYLIESGDLITYYFIETDDLITRGFKEKRINDVQQLFSPKCGFMSSSDANIVEFRKWEELVKSGEIKKQNEKERKDYNNILVGAVNLEAAQMIKEILFELKYFNIKVVPSNENDLIPYQYLFLINSLKSYIFITLLKCAKLHDQFTIFYHGFDTRLLQAYIEWGYELASETLKRLIEGKEEKDSEREGKKLLLYSKDIRYEIQSYHPYPLLDLSRLLLDPSSKLRVYTQENDPETPFEIEMYLQRRKKTNLALYRCNLDRRRKEIHQEINRIDRVITRLKEIKKNYSPFLYFYQVGDKNFYRLLNDRPTIDLKGILHYRTYIIGKSEEEEEGHLLLSRKLLQNNWQGSGWDITESYQPLDEGASFYLHPEWDIWGIKLFLPLDMELFPPFDIIDRDYSSKLLEAICSVSGGKLIDTKEARNYIFILTRAGENNHGGYHIYNTCIKRECFSPLTSHFHLINIGLLDFTIQDMVIEDETTRHLYRQANRILSISKNEMEVKLQEEMKAIIMLHKNFLGERDSFLKEYEQKLASIYKLLEYLENAVKRFEIISAGAEAISNLRLKESRKLFIDLHKGIRQIKINLEKYGIKPIEKKAAKYKKKAYKRENELKRQIGHIYDNLDPLTQDLEILNTPIIDDDGL